MMAQPNQHSKREIELAGLLTPRERIWATVRRYSKRKPAQFGALEIQEACLPLVNHTTVRNTLAQFARTGHLSCIPGQIIPSRGNRRTEPLYALERDQLDPPAYGRSGAAQARGLGNLAMWRAMKVLKTFSAQELAQAASAGTVSVSPMHARNYMLALAKAGLLQLTAGAAGVARMQQRYRLVNWTGPKAPMFSSTKCVLDRNTGAVTMLASAQEMVDANE